MDFFSEFNWAVPKAFADALAACCFEAGDILYRSNESYEPWAQDNLPAEYGLQVIFPARSSGSKSSENQESTFIRNWESPVEVVCINDGRKIKSTQGHLYHLLSHGDMARFESTDTPAVPLLLDELKKKLGKKEILEQIKVLLEMKAPGTTAGVMAYDETDGVAVDKSLAISRALNDVSMQVVDLPLDEFPTLAGLNFLPTLKIRVFALPSTQIKKCRNLLVEALWPRRTAQSATKSFCDIVNRTRSISANSFKLANHINILDTDEALSERNGNDNIPKSLQNFLAQVEIDLPVHLFTQDNLAAAELAFEISAQTTSKEDNSLQLANTSGEEILATDLPLWVESEELKDYEETFGSAEVLAGKIHVLRRESSGQIGIWVRADSEANHANLTRQAFMLAVMLAARTGLKMSLFTCGYFIENETYWFDPQQARVSPCMDGGDAGGNPQDSLF